MCVAKRSRWPRPLERAGAASACTEGASAACAASKQLESCSDGQVAAPPYSEGKLAGIHSLTSVQQGSEGELVGGEALAGQSGHNIHGLLQLLAPAQLVDQPVDGVGRQLHLGCQCLLKQPPGGRGVFRVKSGVNQV